MQKMLYLTDRIAALTTERMSWEDWKLVQKESAAKAAGVAAEEESQMREYREQLDRDRNALLSKGRNNAHLRVQVYNSPSPQHIRIRNGSLQNCMIHHPYSHSLSDVVK
jgi:hypothetical protein